MDVSRFKSVPTAGYEALRDAIYHLCVLDYREKVRKGLIPVGERKFLVSGAYQMDAEIGKRILEILERE